MNYQQTLEYLFTSLPSFQNIGGDAYKPGLERISEFCTHLGDPHSKYHTIHVAGTNGKGSTSHILASILMKAGYRVGLFTSPHLHDFRERIKINGEMISQNEVVDFVGSNREKMESLSLSFFEMTTALAFNHFAKGEVDVAVIETGLGGRLDASNIITPILSVVTNVALEHVAYLGDTIEKIAREKAGIIKPNVPIVLGEKSDEYNHVFEERAKSLSSKLVYAQDVFEVQNQQPSEIGQLLDIYRRVDNEAFPCDLDLGGIYQKHNMVTVFAAIDLLNESTPLSISKEATVDGVAVAAQSTSLMGRWQKLSTSPLVVCDTGHNPHGIAMVTKQIAQTQYSSLYCVMGFAKDKELDKVLPLLPREAYYIFTQPSVDRALNVNTLYEKATEFGLRGEVVDNVASAIERARAMAQSDDMVFIGGSNFVVAEIDMSKF